MRKKPTRHNLTARMLDGLKAKDGKRIEVRDSGAPGLGLRVTGLGRKTWVFVYSHGGKLYRITLGEYPYMSLAEARAKASELRATVLRGENPVSVARAVAEAALPVVSSFGDVAAV